jgi:uroporphyrin-3 C-methyltransferase
MTSTDKAAGDTASDSPTRAGNLPALIALAVAVVALGVSLWALAQLMSLQALPAMLAGEENALRDLNRRVVLLEDDELAQRNSIEELRKSLQDRLAELEGLPATVERLEEQVASVPGISDRSRSEWLKTEALYYLRLGNAQALLRGDAQVAASALELADDKLRESGDPSVVGVRARLAEEIASLRAIPEIDRAGISFRLQSLAAQVNDWPLKSAAPDKFAPEQEEPEAGLGPWDRFVATLKSVFSSIVSVKETDERPVAQLGAAQRALVVESIRAELQVARLAFATGNAELFGSSLERSVAQIQLYFDTDSAPVSAALDTLGEIQGTEMAVAMPDISGSLALLLSLNRQEEGAADGAQ